MLKLLILLMLILKGVLVWCAEGGSPTWSGFQGPGDEWWCEGGGLLLIWGAMLMQVGNTRY